MNLLFLILSMGIVTSTTDISSVVKALAPLDAKVVNIVPGGVCPGHFDLSPGEANLIFLSDLIIYHGYESWFKKIEELDQFPKLEELYLRRNQIEKIEGLDTLTNLKILNIAENKLIKKIEGLDNLTNLKVIVLDDNQIKKIEGLGKLSNLERLCLEKNQINAINGVDHLSKLTLMDVTEPDAKEKIRKDLLRVINATLPPKLGEVREVLFTTYIIQ